MQQASSATEVNWKEVARRCCMPPQHADARWKAVTKKFPGGGACSFGDYLGHLQQLCVRALENASLGLP